MLSYNSHIGRPLSRIVVPLVNFFMYVSKSTTFPTLHIGHSRHGLIFDTKPSEKDHDLPGIRIRDLWSSSSSQHTEPLHHLARR
jgi:hypothetical protein